jgi:hypothetical protein
VQRLGSVQPACHSVGLAEHPRHAPATGLVVFVMTDGVLDLIVFGVSGSGPRQVVQPATPLVLSTPDTEGMLFANVGKVSTDPSGLSFSRVKSQVPGDGQPRPRGTLHV